LADATNRFEIEKQYQSTGNLFFLIGRAAGKPK